MARRRFANFGEYLYWCYASMQMLMVALKRGLLEYDRSCYALREKYFKGYKEGRFSPSSLVNNTLARFSDLSQCWYCGAPAPASGLTRDHVLPLSKGGSDSSDNIFMVCSRCNSSKCDSDLMSWYFSTFVEAPPLYLWATYLKLVYQFAVAHDLMDKTSDALFGLMLPFDVRSLSYEFPIKDFIEN